MRPLPTFVALAGLPGGAGLFRLLMLLTFRWREVQGAVLVALAHGPVPAWLLRWAVARREQMLLRWHADLQQLQQIQAELSGLPSTD